MIPARYTVPVQMRDAVNILPPEECIVITPEAITAGLANRPQWTQTPNAAQMQDWTGSLAHMSQALRTAAAMMRARTMFRSAGIRAALPIMPTRGQVQPAVTLRIIA